MRFECVPFGRFEFHRAVNFKQMQLDRILNRNPCDMPSSHLLLLAGEAPKQSFVLHLLIPSHVEIAFSGGHAIRQGCLVVRFATNVRTKPVEDSARNTYISALSRRLGGEIKAHTAEHLDQWFETLPFPLASILRAWQATPSQDFKTKHEHLLHFFEGTAEFLSVILLSAFSSNEAVFGAHKQKLTEALLKQNLSFQRATFGTWKLVVEYLSKKDSGRALKLLPLVQVGPSPQSAKNSSQWFCFLSRHSRNRKKCSPAVCGSEIIKARCEG